MREFLIKIKVSPESKDAMPSTLTIEIQHVLIGWLETNFGENLFEVEVEEIE